ncbi:neuroglobin-2-like, partial [Pollicipes pollicipes]|uniref:neuroglobin-2-like n=1 Tax=Pollicipes pollicipes TaxID=41117 RepID=UPI001884A106
SPFFTPLHACSPQRRWSVGDPIACVHFLKLFEEHEALLNFFEKFRELRTKDEQAESLELAEHAAMVMATLDESIRALEDMDAFFVLLHQAGAAHTKVPGFKTEFFWKIKNPFLEAVKVTLGDAYTDNMDSIYRITIDFVLSTLVEGFEKAESAANS